MDDGLIASIIIGICFWGFIGIIKSISEYKLLSKLAEKSQTTFDPGEFNFLKRNSSLNNLKWGIIIILGGLGLVLIHYLNLSSDSPLPYGIESIFIAIGFIAYFLIEKYSNTNSKTHRHEN